MEYLQEINRESVLNNNKLAESKASSNAVLIGALLGRRLHNTVRRRGEYLRSTYMYPGRYIFLGLIEGLNNSRHGNGFPPLILSLLRPPCRVLGYLHTELHSSVYLWPVRFRATHGGGTVGINRQLWQGLL